MVSWILDRNDTILDPIVRQAWRLVLDANNSLVDPLREDWHAVQPQIGNEGWNARTIRAFAGATRPRITVQRPWSYAPVPPTDTEPPTLERIGHFDVEYPDLMKDTKG